jgi:type IV pilus assembly protein PilV
MRKSANIPSSSRARGFTLVESLVALLVLSIGLLGVAGLQLTGVRANQSAAWRSQATYLSYDILERMRLNPANRADYVVDLAPDEAEEVDPEAEVPPVTTASEDVAAWKANLANSLPSGDGSVALDAGDDLMVTVTIQWNDARGDSAGAADEDPLTFVMRSRL